LKGFYDILSFSCQIESHKSIEFWPTENKIYRFKDQLFKTQIMQINLHQSHFSIFKRNADDVKRFQSLEVKVENLSTNSFIAFSTNFTTIIFVYLLNFDAVTRVQNPDQGCITLLMKLKFNRLMIYPHLQNKISNFLEGFASFGILRMSNEF
jgi:hypothetical protein